MFSYELISNLKQKILQLQVFECFSVKVGGGLWSVEGSSADLPTAQVCGNLGKEQKCLLFFPPKDCSQEQHLVFHEVCFCLRNF